ncbi:MAG: hypothetical protein ACK4RV_10185 [Caulobacter sp.]
MQAFFGLLHIDPMVWEIRLIRRLDEAVMRVWAEQAPKPKQAPAGPKTVHVSDTAGVRALLRSKAKPAA